MNTRETARLALRYTFPSGKGQLSTFLSSLSMLGLVLAIALLIIVLSVMNGFDKEMRERILSLVPHITLHASLPREDWREQLATLAQAPVVTEVTPFVSLDALLIRGADIDTARVLGVATAEGELPAGFLHYLDASAVEHFRREANALIVGRAIAERLGVTAGDSVTLVVPAQKRGFESSAARFAAVELVAVLDTGTELDQALAIIPLPLASKLAGLEGSVSGFRVMTRQLFEVEGMSRQLVALLPPGYYATNWRLSHGNLYAAIQLSRKLVAILLLSIIAVAAFNVVSSLVLVVLDKRGNIAILRTLGASRADIARIFILQGAMIGAVGILIGMLAGALGSLAVPQLVAWLEGLLGIRFLNTDVYPVSFLPVELLLRDVLLVGGVAMTMCVLAAIYPARRAAALAPAQVLNDDY